MSGIFVRCIIGGMNTDSSSGLAVLREGILSAYDRQKDYAQALVADLSNEDMVAQPVDGVVMNHPAWLLSHLNVYFPVMTTMLDGGAPEDPIDHKHGRNSAPKPDASDYLPGDELIARFLSLHNATAEAFRKAGPEILAKETPIPRYIGHLPTIGYVVIHLMFKHESTHLGQLSAWRRAGGRPMVTP